MGWWCSRVRVRGGVWRSHLHAVQRQPAGPDRFRVGRACALVRTHSAGRPTGAPGTLGPTRRRLQRYLVRVVDDRAAAEAFLVTHEPNIEPAALLLGRDAEVEPSLRGVLLLQQMVDDGVDGAA